MKTGGIHEKHNLSDFIIDDAYTGISQGSIGDRGFLRHFDEISTKFVYLIIIIIIIIITIINTAHHRNNTENPGTTLQ